MPAKAGIHKIKNVKNWIPTFAGMTELDFDLVNIILINFNN